jgi:hypothetical protein
VLLSRLLQANLASGNLSVAKLAAELLTCQLSADQGQQSALAAALLPLQQLQPGTKAAPAGFLGPSQWLPNTSNIANMGRR